MTGEYGYVGKILRVDLSSGSITHMPTRDYADRFLGGRGIGAKIYWDEVSPDVKPLDPENRLIFLTGPVTAVPPAGSRWQICGRSPAMIPDHFYWSGVGGSWGAHLKFAGYDGVVIQGKSDKPVYVFIQDDVVEIRDASALWGKGSVEVQQILKRELGSSVRVAATGPAGENMVAFANVVADNDSNGSSGFGAVMGSKKLKAIAVRGSGKVTTANPGKLRELTKYIRELRKDAPVEGWATTQQQLKPDYCHACQTGICVRHSFEAKDGTKGKFMCASGLFYQERARGYSGERIETAFFANRLCDQYGVDVFPIMTTIHWLARCYRHGVLTDENTGIPLSKMGSLEFIESLVKKISLREGFGDILAHGPVKAADLVGGRAKELLHYYVYPKSGHMVLHCPRLYIANAMAWAMEPRMPLEQLGESVVDEWVQWVNKVEGSYVSSDVFREIAKRFWGSEIAADYSTYEGKALAAKKIRDRSYARECLILCRMVFPIRHVRYSEDHVGDPTIESKILSAVTGEEVDEEGLNRIGERVLNLQRAITVREGHRGREGDKLPELFHTIPLVADLPYNLECLVPGKDGEVTSRRGAVVDREKFEGMLDEYYQLRGWDVATGLQTKAKLEELGLGDIVEDLAQRKLIV